MKIPAIRARIGIWSYYLAALKFSDIRQCVNDPVQFHKSKVYSELFHKSITNKVKKIADYITTSMISLEDAKNKEGFLL